MLQLKLGDQMKVTESAMLPNRETGEDNEVDILLESMVGSTPVCIAIECTATGRKASMEWVQRMYGKHQSLPVHVSVLVSKSGFTKNALATAAARNIHTMALSEAEAAPWLDVVEDLQKLAIGFFTFRVKSSTFEFEGPLPDPLPDIDLNRLNGMHVQRGLPDDPILVSALLKGIAGNQRPSKEIMLHWLGMPKKTRPEKFEATISWQPAPGRTTALVTENGSLLGIAKIDVLIEVTISNTPLQLTPGRLGDINLAYGTANNMVDCSTEPMREVVIALSQTGSSGLSGQMMIPSFEGGDDRVFDMIFHDSDE